jgi:hypothetical protein
MFEYKKQWAKWDNDINLSLFDMIVINFYSNVLWVHGEYFVCCGVLQVKGVTTAIHQKSFFASYLFFV